MSWLSPYLRSIYLKIEEGVSCLLYILIIIRVFILLEVLLLGGEGLPHSGRYLLLTFPWLLDWRNVGVEFFSFQTGAVTASLWAKDIIRLFTMKVVGVKFPVRSTSGTPNDSSLFIILISVWVMVQGRDVIGGRLPEQLLKIDHGEIFL